MLVGNCLIGMCYSEKWLGNFRGKRRYEPPLRLFFSALSINDEFCRGSDYMLEDDDAAGGVTKIIMNYRAKKKHKRDREITDWHWGAKVVASATLDETM